MSDCGAPGADSRGFRSPDLFLGLVLAPLPGTRSNSVCLPMQAAFGSRG
jgi:hypothetical protein